MSKRPRQHPESVATIHYRLRITGVPDRENLTVNVVKLTVLRQEEDSRGQVIGKPIKVRDPIMVRGWTRRAAYRKAERVGAGIIAEDQASRNRPVIPPNRFHRRG